MALYRVTRQNTGTYSISATLTAGREVVHRSAKVKVAAQDVGSIAVTLAEEVAAKREQLKAARDSGRIPEVTQ